MKVAALATFSAMKVRLPETPGPTLVSDAINMLKSLQDKIALFKTTIERRLSVSWKPIAALHESVVNAGANPSIDQAMPIAVAFDKDFPSQLYVLSIMCANIMLSDLALKAAIEVIESDDTRPDESEGLTALVSDVVEKRQALIEIFTQSYNSIMTLAAISSTVQKYQSIQSMRSLLAPILTLSTRQQTHFAAIPGFRETSLPVIDIEQLPAVDISAGCTIRDVIELDILLVHYTELAQAAMRNASHYYGTSHPVYIGLAKYCAKAISQKAIVGGITDQLLVKYHYDTLASVMSYEPNLHRDSAIVLALLKKYGQSPYDSILSVVGSPLNIQ